MQMGLIAVRVAVAEIGFGGESGGGEGGGAEKTQKQREKPCSQRLLQPPAHYSPGTVTASSSPVSPPSASVTSACNSQSPAIVNAKSWVW